MQIWLYESYKTFSNHMVEIIHLNDDTGWYPFTGLAHLPGRDVKVSYSRHGLCKECSELDIRNVIEGPVQ